LSRCGEIVGVSISRPGVFECEEKTGKVFADTERYYQTAEWLDELFHNPKNIRDIPKNL
jgi:hypothetical protein